MTSGAHGGDEILALGKLFSDGFEGVENGEGLFATGLDRTHAGVGVEEKNFLHRVTLGACRETERALAAEGMTDECCHGPIERSAQKSKVSGDGVEGVRRGKALCVAVIAKVGEDEPPRG